MGGNVYQIHMNPRDEPKDKLIWTKSTLFIITGAIQRNWCWGEYECLDFEKALNQKYFKHFGRQVNRILRYCIKNKELKNFLLSKSNYDNSDWLYKLGANR